MKMLKLQDDVHSKLKDYLKDKPVFMQKFVENLITEAIRNDSLTTMKYKIIDKVNKILTTKAYSAINSQVDLIFINDKKLSDKNYITLKVKSDNINDIINNINKILKENNKPILSEKLEKKNILFNVPDGNVVKDYFQLYDFEENDFYDILGIKDNCLMIARHFSNKNANLNLFKLEEELRKKPNNKFELEEFRNVSVDICDKNYLSPDIDSKNIKFEERAFNIELIKKDILKKIKELTKQKTSLTIHQEDKDNYKKIIEKILFCENNLINNNFKKEIKIIFPTYVYDQYFKNLPNEFFNNSENINKEKYNLEYMGKMQNIDFFCDDTIDDIYIYNNTYVDQKGLKFLINENFYSENTIQTAFAELGDDISDMFVKITLKEKIDTASLTKAIENNFHSFININRDVSEYKLESKKFDIKNPMIGYNNHVKYHIYDILCNETLLEINKNIFDEKNIFNLNEDIKGIINEDEPLHKQQINYIDKMIKNIEKNSNNKEINVVCNGQTGAMLLDYNLFVPKIEEGKNTFLYKIGSINDINFFVNPFLRWDDNKVLIIKNVNIGYNKDLLSIELGKKRYNCELKFKLDCDIVYFNFDIKGYV